MSVAPDSVSPGLGPGQHDEEDGPDQGEEEVLEEDDTDSKHAAIQQATLDRPLDNVGLRLLLSPAGVPQSLLLPPLQGTTFSNALDLPDWTVPVEQQLPVYVSLLELLFSLLSSLVVQEEKLNGSSETISKPFTKGIDSVPQDLEGGWRQAYGWTSSSAQLSRDLR